MRLSTELRAPVRSSAGLRRLEHRSRYNRVWMETQWAATCCCAGLIGQQLYKRSPRWLGCIKLPEYVRVPGYQYPCSTVHTIVWLVKHCC